jgi:pantetheine-phosphate adenylyltransferase
MVTAVYPGSFDPITLGHLDIVQRASQLFDTVWMAVAPNTQKQPMLDLSQRLTLIKASVGHLSNVFVAAFDGLTVQFAQEKQARILIRGLRALSDFEKECAMAQMNKKLAPTVETVFLMASGEHQFLSSSLVKEVAHHGLPLDELVPGPVVAYFERSVSV